MGKTESSGKGKSESTVSWSKDSLLAYNSLVTGVFLEYGQPQAQMNFSLGHDVSSFNN